MASYQGNSIKSCLISNFIVSQCCIFYSNKLFSPPLKRKMINCLITAFSLFCGIFVKKVEKPYVAIDNVLFLLLRFLIVPIIGWLLCIGQNDLTAAK